MVTVVGTLEIVTTFKVTPMTVLLFRLMLQLVELMTSSGAGTREWFPANAWILLTVTWLA